MVAKPRVAPYAPPTSRTPNVWPVIGTGVHGRWNTTCADAAIRATPSATSTASATRLTARLRGWTSDGTSAVEDTGTLSGTGRSDTVILGNTAPREIGRGPRSGSRDLRPQRRARRACRVVSLAPWTTSCCPAMPASSTSGRTRPGAPAIQVGAVRSPGRAAEPSASGCRAVDAAGSQPARELFAARPAFAAPLPVVGGAGGRGRARGRGSRVRQRRDVRQGPRRRGGQDHPRPRRRPSARPRRGPPLRRVPPVAVAGAGEGRPHGDLRRVAAHRPR